MRKLSQLIALTVFITMFETALADIPSGPDVLVIGGLYLLVILGLPLAVLTGIAIGIIWWIKKKNAK